MSDLPPGINANGYEYTPPVALPGAVVSAPYQYTPVGAGQHNLVLTTVQSLSIPSGALYAWVTISGAVARYTSDGTTTPTGSIGMPIAVGVPTRFEGPAYLAGLKFIGAGATLDIEYFK